MSGLAHVFEDHGIATTLVALVRLHAEKMRPPRALWVPFELGRPVGSPGNAALQLTVLRAALGLFGSATKAGEIVDFDGEQSDAVNDPVWRSPLKLSAADVASEVGEITPAYESAVAARGRTTVGVCGLTMPAAAQYLLDLHADASTTSPVKGLASAQVMRYAADDLKAMYLEAVTHTDGQPSSHQLGEWLWTGTHLGKLLRQMRLDSIASNDAARRTVGTGGLVNAEWAARLGE